MELIQVDSTFDSLELISCKIDCNSYSNDLTLKRFHWHVTHKKPQGQAKGILIIDINMESSLEALGP